MMKIHIMNLLQLVPNGDFPPPQSEANTRCCSAKVASINSLHLLSARFPKYGHVYALTRRFAAPSPRGRGTNLPNGPSPPGRRWPEGPDEGKYVTAEVLVSKRHHHNFQRALIVGESRSRVIRILRQKPFVSVPTHTFENHFLFRGVGNG